MNNHGWIFLLLTLALILPACKTAEKPTPTGRIDACNWPPDTLLVTLQGSGRIAVHFLWRDSTMRASVCPSQTFVLARTQESEAGGASTPMMRSTHTPPDTTPATKVAMILDLPEVSGGNELYLVKWPPDTTHGGGE
jgi:hypothetical protein